MNEKLLKISYYSLFKTAFLLFFFFSILTGIIYPLFITGCAQLFFPFQANGSILQKEESIGSELIGQFFQEPQYFWGRPSATTPYPYNAESSSASNKGPKNWDYLQEVKQRVVYLTNHSPENSLPIPVDLITASGSGLDPHISPEAAFYQATRVANARRLSIQMIEDLIRHAIENPQWGFLGEPRVNVLKLNLALDALRKE